MSGSAGKASNRVYDDPLPSGEFIGPLRPGEDAPRVSVAEQWLRDQRTREKQSTGRVYDAIVAPVVAPVTRAATSAARAVKKWIVFGVVALVLFVLIAFVVRRLVAGLVGRAVNG